MSVPNIELAIVIPAYKAAFFARALESIASQTDQRFRLYVGDDCSPADLKAIVQSKIVSIDTHYHRFPENRGGHSLVQHLNRCIRLSHENWVWLFSDDDVMEPDCVAAFYRELEPRGKTHDIFRFNTIHIDPNGRLLEVSTPHPCVESSVEFAYHRLRGVRHCTAQELIFSRQAFENIGGFMDLPCGWCSDDAAVIALGTRGGIRTIHGPLVHFRMSGQNLTSMFGNAALNRNKRKAVMEYIEWLLHRFESAEDGRLTISRRLLQWQAESWFIDQCLALKTLQSLGEARDLARFSARIWGGSFARYFLRFMKWNVQLVIARIRKAPLLWLLRARPAPPLAAV